MNTLALVKGIAKFQANMLANGNYMAAIKQYQNLVGSGKVYYQAVRNKSEQ